jgi:predicted glycoside hydrolase/deacetylase ChbG (UPF0249 family)
MPQTDPARAGVTARMASEAFALRAGERAVVVHVDDIGLCENANTGALRAFGGTATSGSIMVPCAAFPQIAEIARVRPQLDLGVHLTLNCEYENPRWRPLRPDVPSLCATDGALLRTPEETARRASLEEVRRELAAQIDRALDAGIDVTHLDAHMGTALLPEFASVYIDLAREYALPAFIPRVDRALLARIGMSEAWGVYRSILEHAATAGLPLFDHFDSNSLHFAPGTGLEHNRRRIAQLRPGLSYLITHCAEGGAALQSICPDWRQRSEECQLYSDGAMSRALELEGVRPVGMRPLRDWLRRQA